MKIIIAIVCVVLLAVGSVTMPGCGYFNEIAPYAMDVVNLKAESALMQQQYEKIFTLIQQYQASFTEEEWDQLNDIHFAFSETALRVSAILDNPADIPTPTELKQMYELAYIGYVNARDIISVHKEVFTSYQWAQLINFDKKANVYDKQVRAILDNPDTDDINMTLGLMITLGGAAYKYLLPVLVSVI